MNVEKISQKINDLEYRIRLDNCGLERANYNITFANRLNYTQAQIDNFIELSKYYTDKLKVDTNTCNTLKSCYRDLQNGWGAPTSDYLFKCTLPYETVDSLTNYQTQITVDADVVKLFANGVDYNEVITCLDNDDIKAINSSFKSKLTEKDLSLKEVGVELTDTTELTDLLDEPVVVKYGKNNSYKGLIASSSINACYPSTGALYRDLNGDSYHPGVPTFEDITNIQSKLMEKESDYRRLHNLEVIVRDKMDTAIEKMDKALSQYESNC